MKTSITSYIKSLLSALPDPLRIRTSTALVVENAQSVSLSMDGIHKLCQSLEQKNINPDILPGKKISSDRVFFQNVVNFCFWAEKGKPKWEIEYHGRRVKGGWYNLVACFDRSLEEGIPILDPAFLETLTIQDAQSILRSATGTPIPLLEKRMEFLKEAGRVLNQKYDGSIDNLLEEAEFDAIHIAQLLVDDFSSFRDSAMFQGHDVHFFKRAQVCAYDIHALGGFNIKNLHLLTAFADYKLPQVLRAHGVLKYSPRLSNMIDQEVNIPAGSRDEVEIRSATVWACEILANQLKKSPVYIDNVLWLMSQDQSYKTQPHHKTRTTSY